MQTIFKFYPIYKKRPWGGSSISKIGSWRSLPDTTGIGESWEISDREGDESTLVEGDFKGKSIRWLLDHYGSEIMGRSWDVGKRFPVLVKVLDAAERLSLQVHPPPSVATQLGGEPKTEMWYLLHATPSAAVLAGFKKGVSRQDFENTLRSAQRSADFQTNQAVEALIHRLPVETGDAIFIPSGRIHAIDSGCLILEIQQNSDTTYRVYDWGRVGIDGKPRDLHVEQTLFCTDFEDYEPSLLKKEKTLEVRPLVTCPYFQTESWSLNRKKIIDKKTASIIHILSGSIEINSTTSTEKTLLRLGETALLSALRYQIKPLDNQAEFIITWC